MRLKRNTLGRLTFQRRLLFQKQEQKCDEAVKKIKSIIKEFNAAEKTRDSKALKQMAVSINKELRKIGEYASSEKIEGVNKNLPAYRRLHKLNNALTALRLELQSSEKEGIVPKGYVQKALILKKPLKTNL